MNLFRIREEFTDSGIMICFNGPFSHSIIEELGKAVRNHLAAENITKAQVMDVFAIYIELAQNVKNYFTTRDLPPEQTNSSIITIAKRDGKYAVTSGNNVRRSDVEKLCADIDALNALDEAGLRKLYRAQLRKPVAEQALGAGLGLMEVATRSTNKITYNVQDLDDAFAFFSLTAYV